MNACLFVLCVSLSGGGEPRDRWLGEDKLQHYFTSLAATVLVAGGARLAGMDGEDSLYAGVAAGTAVGVGKELLDLRRPATETASLKDLAWDLAGVGTGAAILAQTY